MNGSQHMLSGYVSKHILIYRGREVGFVKTCMHINDITLTNSCCDIHCWPKSYVTAAF